MRFGESRWSKEDLERRLCHALDIAKRVIERLASAGYTCPDYPGGCLRPEKVISETALLLLAASRVTQCEDVRVHIQHLAQLLIPHSRSERMLLGLCLEPGLALDFASAHICLGRLGYPDPEFDILLRRAISSQANSGPERVPHRMLEQKWLVQNWHASSASCKPIQVTAKNTILSRPMDLLGASRDDLYAFTHTLMYVRDFNIKPRRLPRPRRVILAEAEAALAWCLDEQDYDLGGEILLAWPLTGKSWSSVAAFAFRVLAHVEDVAGFLPGPSTRIQHLNGLEGNARTDYLLATAYHTIYVMGLLCAAVLQSRNGPPAIIPRRPAMRGSAKRMLHILDADGHKTHWREEFSRLNDSECDVLAGMLLTIALRRKANQRDFGALRDLLIEGHALGLTHAPAASQAAEMLERIAITTEINSRKRVASERRIEPERRLIVR